MTSRSWPTVQDFTQNDIPFLRHFIAFKLLSSQLLMSAKAADVQFNGTHYLFLYPCNYVIPCAHPIPGVPCSPHSESRAVDPMMLSAENQKVTPPTSNHPQQLPHSVLQASVLQAPRNACSLCGKAVTSTSLVLHESNCQRQARARDKLSLKKAADKKAADSKAKLISEVHLPIMPGEPISALHNHDGTIK